MHFKEVNKVAKEIGFLADNKTQINEGILFYIQKKIKNNGDILAYKDNS